MPKKQPTTPIEEEQLAEEQAEAMSSISDEATADSQTDESAEEAQMTEHSNDTDQAMPAEVAAIHVEEEPEAKTKTKSSKGKSEKPKEKSKPAKVEKATRGAKYQKSKAQVEPGKLYKPADAIELVKKTSFSKFDGGVEIHLHLSQKKTKGNTESTRGVFNLPHGTGKTKKIIILDEAKIEEIGKTKKLDFDIALASPELMPKVARIAKILGPKGKMPDPKSGTVTTDPEKTIQEINSGRAEYRVDASNNVHQLVGKVSWETGKLLENIQVVFAPYPKSRIISAYLTASMGPSVSLDLSQLK
jgi:large subunit ribosomal protein L1